MNISQKQNILTEIDAIQQLDFDKIVLDSVSEGTDLSSVLFGRYNASEFKANLYRVIRQLKAELESGMGLFLPNSENFQNDYGAITLDSEIQNLRTYVADINNKDNAASLLDKFIYYQIRQGFWDKSSIRIHDVDTVKINEAQQGIELSEKALAKNLGVFDSLNKQYEQKLKDFETYLSEKRSEMDKIVTLLAEATTAHANIQQMSNESTSTNAEIKTLLKHINERIDEVAENISEYQTAYSAFNTESSQLKQTLESTIGNVEERLQTAKQGVEFVDGKKEEIIRLTGMAADGSLGSKFDQRHGNLEKGVGFWKWSIPVVTILAIVWTIVVFTCLKSNTGNQWVDILINLLKTSPAFILMGFVFSQYSKERNLQEEYAFKSAVAMTITAYSSMLEKKDEEINKSRQEMLLKAIQQVYLQPKLYSDKSEKIYSMNGKHLKEAILTLTEAVKNIKN